MTAYAYELHRPFFCVKLWEGGKRGGGEEGVYFQLRVIIGKRGMESMDSVSSLDRWALKMLLSDEVFFPSRLLLSRAPRAPGLLGTQA